MPAPGSSLEVREATVSVEDEAWRGSINDPIGVQAAYVLQVLDENDSPVVPGEFGGRRSYFQFALPPQALQIQRSLRAEVLKDVTSGVSVVTGGEGIGRISIQGTHGVGASRDFQSPSEGRNLREQLVAFFDTWVKANDARGRLGLSQLRMVFAIVGGKWSNPEDEEYYVWPEAFPTDIRTAGRPHAWDWSLSLRLLAPRSIRVPVDQQEATSPAAAIKKLTALEKLLDRLANAYRKGAAVMQWLRDLKSKLGKIRDRIQSFVDGVRDAIYSVTDLVRGAAQICGQILSALDPKAMRDDINNAVRGAIYETRRVLGQAGITAQQFRRSSSVQAALTAPQMASLARPVSVAVTPGDSLQGIAARVLGDSARWPELVTINALDFPFLDFSGPGGRPGAAYDGRRVFGAADTLKIPLPASSAPVGVSDDPIGTDFSDMDGSVMVGGKDNLIAALLRRLRTPRGRIPWHPLYGSGLRPLVGSAQAVSDVALIRREATLTVKADPRVLSLRSIQALAENAAVSVSCEAVTPLGPVLVAGPVS